MGTRDIPHGDLRRATVEGIMAYTGGNPDRWWLHRRILADGRVLYLQPMLGGNLGWVRHIETGRRRPEGDAAREYVNP